MAFFCHTRELEVLVAWREGRVKRRVGLTVEPSVKS